MRGMIRMFTRIGRHLWHRLDGLSQPVLPVDDQRGFTVKHSGGS